MLGSNIIVTKAYWIAAKKEDRLFQFRSVRANHVPSRGINDLRASKACLPTMLVMQPLNAEIIVKKYNGHCGLVCPY